MKQVTTLSALYSITQTLFFLLGISLSPFSESLPTCGRITTKQSSSLSSSWWQWAQWEWHRLNPKHCPCTVWARMLREYCLVFWPWLVSRLVASGLLLRMLLSGFLSQPSLGAHHDFPCHLALVECLRLLDLASLSSISISHFSSVSFLKKYFMLSHLFFFRYGMCIPKSFLSNLIICTGILSWSSAVAAKRPLDPVASMGSPEALLWPQKGH